MISCCWFFPLEQILETWLWRMKARGSEVLHEEPFCVISKPTKLSPLAVVWTLVRWELVFWSICLLWWSLRGRNPPTQLALGSSSSWRTGHTKALCDGVITVATQTWGICQFCNWQLRMVAMSCSPQVTMPWNYPPKHINMFTIQKWEGRLYGCKRLLLKAGNYKRNDYPASLGHLC